MTIGVLPAFQVNQWGDSRKQAREERQFLGRLYDEYQRAIDELQTVNDESELGVMSKTGGAFGARNDPAKLQEFQSAPDSAVSPASFALRRSATPHRRS
ncbi:hypothetical protein G7076_00785 [Sphingomonas sp. HDW15A]|uniref:hypothetical protein n=1 Tax=Sphingomonas sp. HDW15A TaxID=2714942 RepID=UPI00140C5324|nr:hypothetical protein [Sphingomonas sp. HDW15A]QIK95221.1 hypothetical protein G7076_00785 [Sphingomonas sp. HDW15A]